MSSESEVLLKRIRAEIQRRKEQLAPSLAGSQAASSGELLSNPHSFPADEETSYRADKKRDSGGLSHRPSFLEKAAAGLRRVKEKTDAARKWPRFLRSARLNQLAVNKGLFDAVQSLVKETACLQEKVQALQSGVTALSSKQTGMAGGLRELSQKQAQVCEKLEGIGCKNAEQTLRLDSFYLEFENAFRGSRQLIRERLQFYIPQLSALKERIPSATAVDVGCGRGEWLEILKECGIEGCGVDSNARMIEECQTRGLNAVCGDGIAHLQSLPADSLAVVSGFHIVEHLALPQLLELFSQSFRVLRPGGMAIFETPNPECLKVSTHSFYFDPTHHNPIPSELLSFLGTHAGFSESQTNRLQPLTQDGELLGYFDYSVFFTK